MRFLFIYTLGLCGRVAGKADETCTDAECMIDTFSAIQQPTALRQVRSHVSAGNREAVYPFDIVQCPQTPVLTTTHMEPARFDAIIEDFKTVFDDLPRVCEGEDCPVADVCGCILRMAGHDFMDYGNGKGGSDACIDMEEPDNAGLGDCLVGGNEGATIEQVYKQHCGVVSLADFVVIAAQAAMTYTRQIYLDATADTSEGREMIDFRSSFKYGRTTGTSCPDNQHLPDPSKGCVDVERVFVNNLGLTWRSAAALMGVHSLGRASPTNSGFNGWWSDAKNSRRFNNNYFVSLYLKGWIPEQTETGKWQWGFSDLNRDDVKDGVQMMLDSDMCLAWGDKTTGHTYKPILASGDLKTCAWTLPNLSYIEGTEEKQGQYPLLDAIDKYNDGEFCGIKLEEYMRDLPGGHDASDRSEQWNKATGWYMAKYGKNANGVFMELREACCNGCKSFTAKKKKKRCDEFNAASGFPETTEDTGEVTHPSGVAKQYVMEFANDEKVWIEAFVEAWNIATTAGQEGLISLI